MKIRPEKIYLPLFVIIVLLQLYLPSFRINILIQLAVLVFFAFIENISFSRKFLHYLTPFCILMGIAFIGTLLYPYKLINIVKDVFHFIKPISGLLLGYIIFKRINNFKLFIQTVVVAAIISAFIHFYILFFMVKANANMDDLREFTKDNFLELFGLFFIIYYKKFEGIPLLKSRLYTIVIIVMLAVSNIMYFSRTMIIVAAILVLSVYGYTKATSRNLKVLGLLVLGVGLMYAYLYSVNIGRAKPGIEGFLYKVKMAPEEVFKTRIDRGNLRDLWDHWRGYEANRAVTLIEEHPSSFIFGMGHGSLVNLKFFAPLTGEPKGIRYISELHNGYTYMLYKTGIIGIIIYLLILLRWYGYIYKSNYFKNVIVSAIGVIYIFSTVTITGTYNPRDIIIFILGGALYYAGLPVKNTINTINNAA